MEFNPVSDGLLIRKVVSHMARPINEAMKEITLTNKLQPQYTTADLAVNNFTTHIYENQLCNGQVTAV
jgi:hypothetical protein